MTWNAWHRISPAAKWRIRASGSTIDEAHARLMEAIRGENQSAKNRIILVAGKRPEMVLKKHDD